ncbi:MAG: glycosyltransferase family 4 protein [Candidatus Hodarchaeales archaeon]|jgi:glycosyltransferase involved in cell wall biosynthesis
MKITLVISHLSIYGGGGKFIMDYANRFTERGHSVTIVAININKNNYKFNEKVNLIELGGSLPTNPLFWFKFKKMKRKYLQAIDKLESDIIVNIHFPTNYFLSKTDKNNKIKYVNYCLEPYRYFHDREFYSRAPIFLKLVSLFLRLGYKRYDIIGMRSATEIIYISKFTGKRIKEWYGRNGILHYIGVDTSKKLENDIDFDLRKKLHIGANIPIIFTLGLSTHLKGANELINIFKKILTKKPETILLIGGRPAKRNEKIVRNLIKKLKIPREKVILYGFIEENLINHFYAQSTITFYTAIDESFGLIPLESMLNGTPVIAFEGGPSETVIDGKTGFVINSNDLTNFSQKALLLLKDKELSKKFSIRGIEHVKQNFSIEKGISSLETIFQNIIKKYP